MMGPRQVEQGALFYNFSIDAHVPADHLLRSIDRFVDLSELRRDLAPFYSSMGRPSIDPELMIRMLIIGYCSVSAPSGGSAKRSISTWRTGGSAGSGSTAMSPITPPSRRTGMAVSAKAIFCGASLKRSCSADRGGAGWRRRLCDRCQPDQGGRQPAKGHRGRERGSAGSHRPSFSRVSGWA